MRTILSISCIISLLVTLITGIRTYRRFDKAIQIVVVYIALQLVSEVMVFITGEFQKYQLRRDVGNLSIVLSVLLVSQFFIFAVFRAKSRWLTTANFLTWATIFATNFLFLQDRGELSSNILLIESFVTVSMSLYVLYVGARNDKIENVFSHPHVRVALIWLLVWSATLFFWATIKILYKNHWKYAELFMHIHEIVNIIGNLGICCTLIFYPKNRPVENL